MYKILIAEDDHDIRQLLKFTLVYAGYHVMEAVDGNEAWKQTCENLPDVLLLDIMMPGMDGFELLSKLTKNPSTKAIPVIMVTAKGEEKDQQHAMANGAFDYIVKPWSAGEVEARVKIALEYSKRNSLRTRVS